MNGAGGGKKNKSYLVITIVELYAESSNKLVDNKTPVASWVIWWSRVCYKDPREDFQHDKRTHNTLDKHTA